MQGKISGCLFGGAVGDAIGYPIEFERNIKDFEHTTYPNDIGVVSDDTQMTLFTANGMLWKETQKQRYGRSVSFADATHAAYLDWFDTQVVIPMRIGQDVTWLKREINLQHRRAPGNTCLTSLSSGKKGSVKSPLNNSKGCGGVMRVAPVGIMSSELKEACMNGAVASAITHGHDMGILPAAMLSAMIYVIVHEDKSLIEAIDIAKETVSDLFADKDVKSLFAMIDKAMLLAKKNISDTKAIRKIGEGWVADEALAIAIYACVKYKNDFVKSVTCAVNHDGDSDSTGAIAGNIMGAICSIDAIPEYYIKNLDIYDIIDEISRDVAELISNGVPEKDPIWDTKYL